MNRFELLSSIVAAAWLAKSNYHQALIFTHTCRWMRSSGCFWIPSPAVFYLPSDNIFIVVSPIVWVVLSIAWSVLTACCLFYLPKRCGNSMVWVTCHTESLTRNSTAVQVITSLTQYWHHYQTGRDLGSKSVPRETSASCYLCDTNDNLTYLLCDTNDNLTYLHIFPSFSLENRLDLGRNDEI